MNFSYETKLKRKGYKIIVGIDEVGVGPLAGNTTVAAVVFPARPKILLENLKDSKQLSPQKREEFYSILVRDLNVEFSVARVHPRVIDRINIYQAVRLAAKRAVLKLEKKIGKNIDFMVLDGRMSLNLEREQTSVIKGDEKIASCAAASIIAKVTRDRAMMRCHKKYPQYRFDLHKGYGTKLHLAMIKKYGPSPIHRKSFKPVSFLM